MAAFGAEHIVLVVGVDEVIDKFVVVDTTLYELDAVLHDHGGK